VAPQARVAVESRPTAVSDPIPQPAVGRIDLAAAAVPAVAPAPLAAVAPVEPAVSVQPDSSTEDTQQRVIEALRNARQSSAADAMEDAVWTIVEGEARIQTELSKTMLPVVMNAEAEKMVRATARDAGVPRLTLLPGSPTGGDSKKAKPVRTGSVQAKALEHPMVQQAQKLFNAEIQTVIDLREGE
jgi:DNA polymerase-3 subunit gamma/tau